MNVKTEDIVKLRKKTGAGMMDCKKALEDANNDFEKAVMELRKKGAKVSLKRADRESKEGFIATYSHGGRIGAMVELNSETDFVSKNEDFRVLAADIAMHVAAASPLYISKEDVPSEVIEREKELEHEKVMADGKPKEIAEKVVVGKIENLYKEICLMEQPFIKDANMTIADLLNEKIAAIGENIKVGKIARFEIGK